MQGFHTKLETPTSEKDARAPTLSRAAKFVVKLEEPTPATNRNATRSRQPEVTVAAHLSLGALVSHQDKSVFITLGLTLRRFFIHRVPRERASVHFFAISRRRVRINLQDWFCVRESLAAKLELEGLQVQGFLCVAQWLFLFLHIYWVEALPT